MEAPNKHPLPSRPTTPLRPSSRTSLRSSSAAHDGASPASNPLSTLEPAFAELADSMADLEANFMHLQLMHESLSRFSESFASFLYGLNMNAFCVDFPEAPIADSFRRARAAEEKQQQQQRGGSIGCPSPARSRAKAKERRDEDEEDDYGDPDMTIVSTATSFVDNPASSKTSSKFMTPAPKQRQTSGIARGVGHGGRGAGRGPGRSRGSGIARGKTRGAR